MNRYTMVMDYPLIIGKFLFTTNHHYLLFRTCYQRATVDQIDFLVVGFMKQFNHVLNLKKGDTDRSLWSLGYTPEDSDKSVIDGEYVYNLEENSCGCKFDALRVDGSAHHVEVEWDRVATGDGIFGDGPYYSYSYSNIMTKSDVEIDVDWKSVLYEDFCRRFIEKEFYSVKRCS